MIIKVKKYLFVGVSQDLTRFLERAQAVGLIEFIPGEQDRKMTLSATAHNLFTVIKLLKVRADGLSGVSTQDEGVSIETPEQLIELAEQLDRKEDELLFIQDEIDQVSPLGHFSLEKLHQIEREGSCHIQFFERAVSPKKSLSCPDAEQDLIQLTTAHDKDYFMSVSLEPRDVEGMIEICPNQPLQALEKAQIVLKREIAQCKRELDDQIHYLPDFQRALQEVIAQDARHFVQSQTANHLDGKLFAIEGWIPASRLDELVPLLQAVGVHAEEVLSEASDKVPTYMENRRQGRVGEDLVHIYDTPAQADRDPSTSVFWAFILFFAIIVSDAGYGLIYLALALYLKKKVRSPQPAQSRFLQLFASIAGMAIVWGILSGSYFGVELPPDHLLNKPSLMRFLAEKKAAYHLAERDLEYQEIVAQMPALEGVVQPSRFLSQGVNVIDGKTKYQLFDDFKDSIFMEIALLIGVLHISFGLLFHLKRHLPGLGWLVAIVGGYLFFPEVIGTTSLVHFLGWCDKETAARLGRQLLIGGIGGAVIFSLVLHRMKGWIEVTKLIELFADILSYLRLYALGLAGMVLAATFNDIGRDLGLGIGFVVILLGHGINIVVGVMSGVIHGLRLNFIEWYHHCFDGGGRRFDPLKL